MRTILETMILVEIGDKLALAREARGLTQAKLAARLGVDTSSVGRWESKQHIPPARVGDICHILGISHEWLEDEADADPRISLYNTIQGPASVRQIEDENMTAQERRLTQGSRVAIPMWRGIAAGSDEEAYFLDSETPELREVDSFLIIGPHPHVLCIAEGHSMSPRIEDRERFILKLDPDVLTGNLVVAQAPDGRNYVKRHVRVNGKRELHSVNGSFGPITQLDGWTIRGGVTAILKDRPEGEPNMEYAFGSYLKA